MDNQIEELLPFYALGALTEEEKSLVEAYLSKHPEARAQISEMQFAASALPHSVSPVEPTSRPQKLLMERVASDPRKHLPDQPKPSRSRPNRLENRFGSFTGFAFTTLSFIIAVAAITWVLFLNVEVSRLQEEAASLRSELDAQRSSMDQLAISHGQLEEQLAQQPPSPIRIVSLQGTEKQPQAYGLLITDPNSPTAVLIVAALAPLEPEQIYQAWLIRGETPVSAGLLNPDARQQGVLILNSNTPVGSFDALGVSVEPAGGSSTPTGDIVILTNLN